MLDKSQFFYRAAIYSTKDQEVRLIDLQNPEASPALEPWLGIVVSLADGQHTLNELFTYIAGQYGSNKPEGFEKTLESVLERLVDTDAIRYSEKPVELPYYLATPYEQQDLEKTKKLMLKDGHLKH